MKIEDLKQIAIYAAKGEAPANYTTESVDDSFLEGIRDLASDYYQFMDNRYAIYDIIVTAISGQDTILKAEWIKSGAFYCNVAGLEDVDAVELKA